MNKKPFKDNGNDVLERIENILEEQNCLLKHLVENLGIHLALEKRKNNILTDKYEEFKKYIIDNKIRFIRTAEISGRFKVSKNTAIKWMNCFAFNERGFDIINNKAPYGYCLRLKK